MTFQNQSLPETLFIDADDDCKRVDTLDEYRLVEIHQLLCYAYELSKTEWEKMRILDVDTWLFRANPDWTTFTNDYRCHVVFYIAATLSKFPHRFSKNKEILNVLEELKKVVKEQDEDFYFGLMSNEVQPRNQSNLANGSQ
jgi:hypothetical protein